MLPARPDPVTYRQHLQALADELAPSVRRTEIRGAHLGQFLFADHRGRAIELYWDEAGICVAFWERGAEAESHESFYRSYEDALRTARQWLAG